jgi:hypothetical protein
MDKAKLSLSFDPKPLVDDVLQIPEFVWQPHYNRSAYEGDWSGVPLRAELGSMSPLYPNPAAEHFADLPGLQLCPGITQALSQIPCELRSVRLLKLGAGSSIKRHRDADLSPADREVRLHVPVITHPNVRFYLNDELIPMREGELWFLNLSQFHNVDNQSPIDRVHLVIDVLVNDWLRAQIMQEREHT